MKISVGKTKKIEKELIEPSFCEFYMLEENKILTIDVCNEIYKLFVATKKSKKKEKIEIFYDNEIENLQKILEDLKYIPIFYRMASEEDLSDVNLAVAFLTIRKNEHITMKFELKKISDTGKKFKMDKIIKHEIETPLLEKGDWVKISNFYHDFLIEIIAKNGELFFGKFVHRNLNFPSKFANFPQISFRRENIIEWVKKGKR